MAAVNGSPSSPPTSCPICVEKFNKSSRLLVTCQYCPESVCRECCQRYILESINDPHCMHCKKEWSRDFLSSFMTKTWIDKELKSHREIVLLDREKSLLPITQHNLTLITELGERLRDLENQAIIVREEIRALQRGEFMPETESQAKVKRKTFVRKCPAQDCRGFLSTRYKCGMCETTVCPDCMVIKDGINDPDHKCNPDDVKSVEYMKAQTKSCPKCGEAIEKAEGCDQMFCNWCHISFSWKTLEIVTKNIHNPHYFEWQRKTQQNVDEGCGNIAGANMVCNKLLPIERHPETINFIESLINDLLHLHHDEIPRLQRDNADNKKNEFRVHYLENKIDEGTWRKNLQKLEKDREKKICVIQILEMYVNTTNTIFKNFVSHAQSIPFAETYFEIMNLREYVNAQFVKYGKLYTCVYPVIHEDNTYYSSVNVIQRGINRRR